MNRYIIIIPTYNEEKTVADTLISMLNQTLLPQEIIVVNDDSTDNTIEAIEAIIHPNKSLIKIISKKNTYQERTPGSKIIQAFNTGYQTIAKQWDALAKMDADILLPTHYFETIMNQLSKDKNIGMIGGEMYFWDEKSQDYVLEGLMKRNHLRGAIKCYSKNCFEKIGGLKETIGWDTIDTILAQSYGFKITVIPELQVQSFYKTGLRYKGIHAQKTGIGMYKMRYSFLIAFISCLKAAWLRKSFQYFYQSFLQGFIASYLKKEPRSVSIEEGYLIRTYRIQGFKKQFTSIFTP